MSTMKGKNMRIKLAILSLGLASSVFALDEYMPLDKGVLELDAGVTHETPDVGDAALSIPLQVKYGVMNGLDVELGLSYATAENASGLDQPSLALKYKLPDMPLAAYVNVVLPFATGDLDVPGLNLGITPGVLYQLNSGMISTILGASYQLNLEADDVKEGNLLTVFAKPSYAVSGELGAYVFATYHMHMEGETAGNGNGDDGYDLVLAPGVTYTLSPSVAFEANIPFTVVEDNMGKAWGIWASVYYTLPL